MVGNILLSATGKVKMGDGREFTRLIGGFSDGKPMLTIWQAAELLNLKTDVIRKNFDRNKQNFEKQLDYNDLRSATTQSRSDQTVDIVGFLKANGLSQNKLNATKQWLAFSFAGMMKLVKIATTKESWEIYDRFLEDYFQTKAENKVMKKTIEEEIEELRNQKALFIGLAVMERDEGRQVELLQEMERINIRIAKLEQSMTREEVIRQLQPKLEIAEIVADTKNCYDIGSFAKILNIKGMGRNNLFRWLRQKKMLMSNNEPYQNYSKYFKVTPVVNENTGYTNNKTLLRPNGLEYIVKKLIEDKKIVAKPVETIVEELEAIGA